MARTATAPAQQGAGGQRQLQPGDYFRWPGRGARARFVEEGGPCAAGTSLTLSQQASTNAGFQKFQTLDIDKGFLLELTFTTTFTAGSGKTLTVNPFSIAQWVQQLQVQFESAYSTFRLPGVLALIFQMYRGQFAPVAPFTQMVQGGANPNAGAEFVSAWQPATSILSTPNLALNVSTSGTQ